jgi:hypothetical protein
VNSRPSHGDRAIALDIGRLLTRSEHAWYTGNLPADEVARRKAAQEELKKRY